MRALHLSTLLFCLLFNLQAASAQEPQEGDSARLLRAALLGDAAAVRSELDAGTRLHPVHWRAFLDGGRFIAANGSEVKDDWDAYEFASPSEFTAEVGVPLVPWECYQQLCDLVGIEDAWNRRRNVSEVEAVLPLLLASQGGPDGRFSNGLSYLEVAMEWPPLMFDALLAAGASPDAKTDDDQSLIEVALGDPQHGTDWASRLFAAGLDPRSALGSDALSGALRDDHIVLATVLYDRGMPGTPNAEQLDAMFVEACKRDLPGAVERLLTEGAAADRRFDISAGDAFWPEGYEVVLGPLDPSLVDRLASFGRDEIGLLDLALLSGAGRVVPLLAPRVPPEDVSAALAWTLREKNSLYGSLLLFVKPEPLTMTPETIYNLLGVLEEQHLPGADGSQAARRDPLDRALCGFAAALPEAFGKLDAETGDAALYSLAQRLRKLNVAPEHLGTLLPQGAPHDLAVLLRGGTPTPLIHACRLGSDEEVMSLARTTDPNTPDAQGCLPLAAAVRFGRDALAGELVDAGAWIDLVEPATGWTPRRTWQALGDRALLEATLARAASPPLRQPLFPLGFTAAEEQLDGHEMWSDAGWLVDGPGGTPGFVTRWGRRADAFSWAPDVQGWLVRKDGHRSLWDRDVVRNEVYDFDAATGLWIVRRGDLWALLDITKETLIAPLEEVRALHPALGLALIRRDGLWGAVGEGAQEVIPPRWDSQAQVLEQLALSSQMALARAVDASDAVVAATRALAARADPHATDGLSDEAVRAACDAVMPTVARLGGRSAELQVLRMLIGLERPDVLRPFLAALGWADLPDAIEERVELWTKLDLRGHELEPAELGDLVVSYLTSVDRIHLKDESEWDALRAKTTFLSRVRTLAAEPKEWQVVASRAHSSDVVAGEAISDSTCAQQAEFVRLWSDAKSIAVPFSTPVPDLWPAVPTSLRARLIEPGVLGDLLTLPLAEGDSLRQLLPISDTQRGLAFLDGTGGRNDLAAVRSAWMRALQETCEANATDTGFAELSRAATRLAVLDASSAGSWTALAEATRLLHELHRGIDWRAFYEYGQNAVDHANQMMTQEVQSARHRLGETHSPESHLAVKLFDVLSGNGILSAPLTADFLSQAPLAMPPSTFSALLAHCEALRQRIPDALAYIAAFRAGQSALTEKMTADLEAYRAREARRRAEIQAIEDEWDREFAEIMRQSRSAPSTPSFEDGGGWGAWRAKMDDIGGENRRAWNDYVLRSSDTWTFVY